MEKNSKIKDLKIRLKKANAQVNKFAALSVKGKCTDEEWEKALDSWGEIVDEIMVFLLDVKINTL